MAQSIWIAYDNKYIFYDNREQAAQTRVQMTLSAR